MDADERHIIVYLLYLIGICLTGLLIYLLAIGDWFSAFIVYLASAITLFGAFHLNNKFFPD